MLAMRSQFDVDRSATRVAKSGGGLRHSREVQHVRALIKGKSVLV